MKQFLIGSTFVVAVLAMAVPADAQYGVYGLELGDGTVTGTGQVTVSQPADRMRMKIELLAKGSSLIEALTALKDRGEAAKAQLTAMGAEADSIQIKAPKITASKTDQQRQIEAMMMQRLQALGRGAPKAKDEVSEPVSASAELTAEWKLSPKDAESLLVSTHKLQEKVKAADLAGINEAADLSAEEEELLEEAQGFGYNSYDSDEQKPGEPAFIFVAPIPDADLEKGLAEAFQKAKANAARLAKAAGIELGALKSLSGSSNSVGDDDYGYASSRYRMMRAFASDLASESQSEALGAEPGDVAVQITVMAAFALKLAE